VKIQKASAEALEIDLLYRNWPQRKEGVTTSRKSLLKINELNPIYIS